MKVIGRFWIEMKVIGLSGPGYKCGLGKRLDLNESDWGSGSGYK